LSEPFIPFSNLGQAEEHGLNGDEYSTNRLFENHITPIEEVLERTEQQIDSKTVRKLRRPHTSKKKKRNQARESLSNALPDNSWQSVLANMIMSAPTALDTKELSIQTPTNNKTGNINKTGSNEKGLSASNYLAPVKKTREEEESQVDNTSKTELNGSLTPSVNERLSALHLSECLIDLESSSDSSETEEDLDSENSPGLGEQQDLHVYTSEQRGKSMTRKPQQYLSSPSKNRQCLAAPTKSDVYVRRRNYPRALLHHVELLEQENQRLRFLLMGKEKSRPPSAWKVLHRVICVDDPERRIYTDEPFKSKYNNKQWHIRGRDLVKNIEIYIERHKELAFIVYHDYFCQGHGVHTRPQNNGDNHRDLGLNYGVRTDGDDHQTRHNSKRRVQEDENVEIKPKASHLHIICDILHRGMLSLLKQDQVLKSSLNYSKDDQEVPLPFLAYYHFRTTLQTALDRIDNEDEQIQLQLLSSYVYSAYSDEFSQADSMLSRGVVTQPFLKYLFVPGEVIIKTKSGQVMGYLQQGFLNFSPLFTGSSHQMEEPKLTTLTGQTWDFNGEFTKRYEKLDVDWANSLKGEQYINKLNVYPLRYASDEVKQSLAARGKTFWACRKHNYVEYQQVMPKKMQNSVSRSKIACS
jgi:uncharacterized protein DUF7025